MKLSQLEQKLREFSPELEVWVETDDSSQLKKITHFTYNPKKKILTLTAL